MNPSRTSFSRLEFLGALLMLAGLGLGVCSTGLSAREVARGRTDYESFISYRKTTVSEMWRCYKGMLAPMAGVEEKLAISRGGFHLFLLGLGIFVVAKRPRLLPGPRMTPEPDHFSEPGATGLRRENTVTVDP